MAIRPRPARDTSGPSRPSVTVSMTNGSGGTLAANHLAVPVLGELAPVMHQEAARAGELVRLPRDHPERKLLVGQIRPGKLQSLRRVVRIDIDRGRRLVHPPRLQFLQAVLSKILVRLSRAVVIGGHPAHPPPSSCASSR